MVWLSIDVNFSTSIGHDSLNLLACEKKTAPKAAITKKVSKIVIAIAITLFIFIRTKKFTTGCKTTAIITAKTIGTIIVFPINNIAIKAIKPIIKMVAFV